MNPETAFKAASPGSIGLQIVSGGVPVDKKLSHAELGGLAEMPYLFGLAYYAGEFSGIERLYSLFGQFSANFATKRGWQIQDPEILQRASRVALEMHLYPQRYSLCRTCCGSGSQRGVHAGKTCKNCNGSGMKPIKDTELAKMIGVDKSNMARTWKGRLDKLYKEAQALHAIIANHLKTRN